MLVHHRKNICIYWKSWVIYVWLSRCNFSNWVSFMWQHHLEFWVVSVFASDPKAETRLYVTVNGFEFHVYNRTDLYARLQETFGLEPTLQRPKKDEERGREDRNKTLERYNYGIIGQLCFLSSVEILCKTWVLFEVSKLLIALVVLP